MNFLGETLLLAGVVGVGVAVWIGVAAYDVAKDLPEEVKGE